MNWAKAVYGRIRHLWISDKQTLCGKALYRQVAWLEERDVDDLPHCQKCQKSWERLNGGKSSEQSPG